MRKANWGIIGLGNIAYKFAYGFAGIDNSCIKGIASHNLDKLSEFRPSSLITVKNLMLVKDLIKKFNFEKFDLIIDNQTRFKNALIYKRIPHKYYVSPCLNYLMNSPLKLLKKDLCLKIPLKVNSLPERLHLLFLKKLIIKKFH